LSNGKRRDNPILPVGFSVKDWLLVATVAVASFAAGLATRPLPPSDFGFRHNFWVPCDFGFLAIFLGSKAAAYFGN